MATTVPLATRERVADALDISHAAYRGPQIDQASAAAAETIAAALHWAHIHPVTATRYFDWPNTQTARPWRLWLEDQGLISLTSLTAGGVTIATGDRLLEPVNDGPPFTRIDVDLASTASFQSGDTHQQAIAATGLWGIRNDEIPAGALAAALTDTTGTTLDVTDGSRVGIGSLLRVDTERLLATDRSFIDTTHNLAGDMDASDADELLVTSGGTWFTGELLQLDTEQVRVRSITGANLTVDRNVNGTVLAAHTGSVDLYASRRFTVERAAAGTTAATHSNGAALVAWKAPPLLEALGVAVAMDQVEQELGAYARRSRSGEAAADATGTGLDAAWARAIKAHMRMRTGAI